MKWIIYNFLFNIGYGLMLPTFLPRLIKRGNFRAHFGERFGRYAPGVASRLREKPRVWIHAVSVGEAKLALNLISELRKLNPDDSYILSTTSTTGRAVCEKGAAPDDVVIYFPLDFKGSVRRALCVVNAKMLILIEGEIWPNIIREIAKLRNCEVVNQNNFAFSHFRNFAIILTCARVSDKSAPRYRFLRYFLKDVFKCFSLILAQSPLDEKRLVAAGADPAKITVTGSAKFDAPAPDAEAVEKSRKMLGAVGIDTEKDLIILGGSTWRGEEAALVRSWMEITGRLGEPSLPVKLVIVPRHAERGGEIEAELKALGVDVIRRSKVATASSRCENEKNNGWRPLPQIFLVDTTGELSA
ncbi:MAG: hypothetical protein FWG05_01535, partial [Kiritimatiellaeota bacterium]|nr:hypothetical protein [Kiritimatiellota bacterium]